MRFLFVYALAIVSCFVASIIWVKGFAILGITLSLIGIALAFQGSFDEEEQHKKDSHIVKDWVSPKY